jgi:hypothetical protein
MTPLFVKHESRNSNVSYLLVFFFFLFFFSCTILYDTWLYVYILYVVDSVFSSVISTVILCACVIVLLFFACRVPLQDQQEIDVFFSCFTHKTHSEHTHAHIYTSLPPPCFMPFCCFCPSSLYLVIISLIC